MTPLERFGHRNLHWRLLAFGIFLVLLLTLLTKTMDGVSSSKIYKHTYMDGAVSVSGLGNGLPHYNIEAVPYYKPVFERLRRQGYLRPASKSLCINCGKDREAAAMGTTGVSNVVEYSGEKIAAVSGSGQGFLHPFGNNTFDFEFFGPRFENMEFWSVQPLETASEVCRTLKQGGYLVVHIVIRDEYSFQSFVNLFTSCGLLRFRDIGRLNSSHSIREAIFAKNSQDPSVSSSDSMEGCKLPKYKWDLMDCLENLSDKEPEEDWTEWQKYQEAVKSFKYLPTMVDLRFKKRYIYIDLGARTFDSTIGNWFLKLYPKQNKEFEIYAIEADKAFHKEYEGKKGITLLPYAAWVKNETLVFGTRNKRREYTGKIQQQESVTQDYEGEQNIVQAFDFADWLMRSFSKQDYVVLKMDVEGTEMDLVPKLVETGAISLIDEMFVECHYDRWVKCCSGKRIQRYNKTYGQCYDLFSKLREKGTLVHQWW